MTHLSVRLLGPLLVTLDGQAITGFETEKVRALLAYLAVEADRPHRRDFLAELLWPDRPTGAANANLRHTLARLRHSLGEAAAQVDADPQAAPPFLHVTRQTIQFDSASNAWVDTKTFIALLRGAQSADLPPFPMLEEAVVLYRGLFWEDAAVTDSAAFEEWLLLTRGHFGRLMLDALHSLATGYEKAGDHAHALVHARHAVETDPCDEPAQRQVMRLLALTGQRSAALAQYEACRTVLAAELGVEPATETTALSQRIRSGELESPAQHRERQPSPPLPAFLVDGAKEAKPSIFVAREQELARLYSWSFR